MIPLVNNNIQIQKSCVMHAGHLAFICLLDSALVAGRTVATRTATCNCQSLKLLSLQYVVKSGPMTPKLIKGQLLIYMNTDDAKNGHSCISSGR